MPLTHLYRYQACARLDRLEPVLLQHELYFPTAAQLNDPADCRPRLVAAAPRQLARFLVRMWGKAEQASLEERAAAFAFAQESIAMLGPSFIREEMTKYWNQSCAQTRILSLSQRWNNMGMWAKYADEHRGYCLEFGNVGMFAAIAREVTYDDVIDLDITAPTALTDSLLLLYRKKRDWMTEEEIRIVGPTTASPTLAIDPAWLTRIILGKDMAAAHRKQIRDWARIRNPPLVVAQAVYDEVEQTLTLA